MRPNPRRTALFESIQPDPGASFRYMSHTRDYFAFNWHYHPQVELTLIPHGRGMRFVGDAVAPFTHGDLCLLGPNLPHTWTSQKSEGRVKAVVVQFDPDHAALKVPEMARVRTMIARARQGLHFASRQAAAIARTMDEMLAHAPEQRYVMLLDILQRLAVLRSRPLVSPAYHVEPSNRRGQLLQRVLQRLHDPQRAPATQPELAALIGMTPQGFSRFFKRQVGRTYVDYLNHYRISTACRWLIETDRPITQIAYEAGFANLSNFNRRFRRLKGVTPRQYRRRMLESLAFNQFPK